MKTPFPNEKNYKTKWFVIDATGRTLGRLATEVSKLLRGKEVAMFTPGVNQSNYVVIVNANQIQVTGRKRLEKLYYRNTTRPGGLKVENFQQLQKRIPTRILEQAIWGMLPKGVLGRKYYRKLFIYADGKIHYKTDSNAIGSTKTISLKNCQIKRLLANENQQAWVHIKDI